MTAVLEPVINVEGLDGPDDLRAAFWTLPHWARKVDSHSLDDAIQYQARLGEVPTLDDPPVTVDLLGADSIDVCGLAVAVQRRPFAVRVAEVRLTPGAARELARLLTSAADLLEAPF